MNKIVKRVLKPLQGCVEIPADKSLSHRAIMFSSLAKGRSVIRNFSKGADCLSTMSVCRQLGVDCGIQKENTLVINSKGSFLPPLTSLDCGNSGTTMRLMSGILVGQSFDSCLTGDDSLSKRPMQRVITPLSQMGAEILSSEGKAPLKILGRSLKSIDYQSSLSSAQVKSCVLLAGLFADGETSYTEPAKSRDHTERMLKAMGANITVDGNVVKIRPSELSPIDITVPGDISSAAFFIVAASIIPESDIILKNVGVNPTRTGIIDVVKRMGGDISLLNMREELGEPVADIRVRYSSLKATTICGDEIPRLIDELPVITLLASQVNGQTVIKDAADLRNKEADRISAVASAMAQFGANITETSDGFIIQGKSDLYGGCEVETFHDHRLAMTYYVAGLIAKNPIEINGFEWINISFPEFEYLMGVLQGD